MNYAQSIGFGCELIVKRTRRNAIAIFHTEAYNFLNRLPLAIVMVIVSSRGVNMNIRNGTIHDASLLSELGAKTFYETFAKDNTQENIDSYLKASFSPEIQLKELSAPDAIFFIVESEETPIGYVQLIMGSRDESTTGAKPLEIRRIYAVQEYLGKGVGSELMKAALNEAHKQGCDCVWLGVWEKNSRAIAFYKKWGFREVSTHSFMLGDDLQNDFVMELVIPERHDRSQH